MDDCLGAAHTCLLNCFDTVQEWLVERTLVLSVHKHRQGTHMTIVG